jgi:hypothetical protein
VPTVGVEEEFLLVDRRTREPAPRRGSLREVVDDLAETTAPAAAGAW